MGKKKKFERIEEIYEIETAKSGLKMKEKAIQFECPHKDKKGNYTLKRAKGKGNDYLFKCNRCHDKKIDLSICNPNNPTNGGGNKYEQLKHAIATVKSAIDLAKLQSNSKDEKTLKLFATTLKNNWACKRILKKIFRNTDNGGKKKFHKTSLNTTNNGNSLRF